MADLSREMSAKRVVAGEVVRSFEAVYSVIESLPLSSYGGVKLEPLVEFALSRKEEPE